MPVPSRVPEIGLDELIHQLICQTFEATASARLTQQRQRAELTALAAMELDAYADTQVSTEEVDRRLAELFPVPGSERPHAIQPGAGYRPASHPDGESPPIFALTGIELDEEDLGSRRTRGARPGTEGSRFLRSSAVTRVRDCVRRQLAEAELTSLRELVRAGLPTVCVDGGSLDVKVTCSVGDERSGRNGFPVDARDVPPQLDPEPSSPPADEVPPQPGPRSSSPLPGLPRRFHEALKRGSADPASGSGGDLRLLVRPADERRPEISQLAADVFGSIRIDFRMRD